MTVWGGPNAANYRVRAPGRSSEGTAENVSSPTGNNRDGAIEAPGDGGNTGCTQRGCKDTHRRWNIQSDLQTINLRDRDWIESVSIP